MPELQVAEITVEIVRKDIKNLHLGVYPPNGRVRVAAPLHVDDEAVRLAVISKLSWIRKQVKNFQNQERQSQREFVSRESHYFLGKRYLLSVVEKSEKPSITVTPSDSMILTVRPGASSEKKEKVLSEWYRSELKKVSTPLIEKWEKVLKVNVSFFGIRKMKTKWGSCNSTKGRILINTELVKKPPRCIEYVVLHEVAHLIEKRHNDHFRELLDQHMPHWQLYRDELNESPLGPEKWKE